MTCKPPPRRRGGLGKSPRPSSSPRPAARSCRSATLGDHPTIGAVRLHQNGEIRQRGNVADVIWSVPEIIGKLSELFELASGDLIFTGTLAGVGPVSRADFLTCDIEGVGAFNVAVR